MQLLRLISRDSELAICQANLVKLNLNLIYPELAIEIHGITTQGDQLLTQSLDKIGGKGLFIKELQTHLLKNTSDVAVHSLKDLPMGNDHIFYCAAVLAREDPHDAFISNKYNSFEMMPAGSIVGTSSARRLALIKHFYPHLAIKLLRGNVLTRLKKLDNNEFDAIVLASAGLKRLNLGYRIKELLALDKFVPAIGQGTIALEILSKRLDLMLVLGALDDNDTCVTTFVERSIGKLLHVDCSAPIGVYASFNKNDTITVRVAIHRYNTQELYFLEMIEEKNNYLKLPKMVINELIQRQVIIKE